MGKPEKDFSEKSAVPSEKMLIWPEYCRYEVKGI